MRNITVFLATLLMVVVATSMTFAAPLKYGIKAGMAFDNQDVDLLRVDATWETKYTTGFTFGVFTEWSLTPALAIQPELMYVQKGSKSEVPVVSEESPIIPIGMLTLKERMDYLSLSVLGKVRIPVLGQGLYALAGPRIDIKVGEDSEIEPLVDFDMDYKKTIIGATAGIGFQVAVGPAPKVFVEATYHHDFDNATDNSVIDIKNRAILVTAGVKF
ncbi:MAG: porin family protein [candidate division Zixibacteria bacterium]|nr:porin family protein [candidate division Zixibacteria bacterium]